MREEAVIEYFCGSCKNYIGGQFDSHVCIPTAPLIPKPVEKSIDDAYEKNRWGL